MQQYHHPMNGQQSNRTKLGLQMTSQGVLLRQNDAAISPHQNLYGQDHAWRV